MIIYYDELETMLGPMTILMHEQAVVRIDYGTQAELMPMHEKWIEKNFQKHSEMIRSSAQLQDVKDELSSYLSGERTEFTFTYQPIGTDFQKQVWQALVQSVSYGKTASYKQIAEAINNPKAVRAVGGAVNKNPLTIVVPCHRVIGANGKMVGYNGGVDKKEFLLRLEQR